MASKALAEANLVVDATPERLDAIHAALEEFRKDLSVLVPEDKWIRFTTAVAEVSANVMRHAYGGDAPPGKLQLRLKAYPDRVEAAFTDRGAPYSASAAMRLSTSPESFDLGGSELPEAGLGLGLVRMTVDEMHYRRSSTGMNRWRVVQKLAETRAPRAPRKRA